MALFKKSKKLAGWMSVGLQADGICAAYITRTSATLPVVEWVAFYPTNALSDAVQLDKLSKELHTTRYHCTTLLTPGDYQILAVDAPNVPQDELKTAIRWRLKDMLDFHVDDATVDVLDIPVEKNVPVRNHTMYAVAARNQLIEQRQSQFSEAKISLSAIDIPELAQRNISVLMEAKDRGIAMLAFDGDGGLLTVTFGGELYLSRRIDITLGQLAQAIGDAKNALFERITLELQRSLDHFDRQFHFITLSKLMLFPVVDSLGGLQEYLAGNLYVPVEALNLSAVLDFAKVEQLQQPENQQRYFNILGAALRLEEKVL